MSDTPATVILTVEFTPQEAWDLAQLLKRLGFSDVRNNAIDNDEAYQMINAAEKVRKALAEAGYEPR